MLPDENEAEMREKAPDDESEEESDDGDNEDEVITEIRFVPSDTAACECVHLKRYLALDWRFLYQMSHVFFFFLQNYYYYYFYFARVESLLRHGNFVHHQ